MTSVFVSHSKDDIKIRKFFAEIFANIGLKANFMEWKDLTGKYAGDIISRMIRAEWMSGYDTKALFVLLGNGVSRPMTNTPQYTHNWISFEAGAAASCLKPVWVFEDFKNNVNFPIPFVTDYIKYNLDSKEDLQFLSRLFQQEIIQLNIGEMFKPTYNIICPYVDCNAKYRYWSSSGNICCPVCKGNMQIINGVPFTV